jgi:hypothetical protein
VQAREPVRISGHLSIAGGEARIVDASGSLGLTPTPKLVAYDERGPLAHLEDGQLVDVVGTGDRKLGAGEGYRDSRGEFVLSADQVIEVLVRRPR